MSFFAELFKSLNIGGPTYFDKINDNKELSPANQKLKPPTTGLLGALGVGQVEKKIGPLTFQAVNMNPTTDKEIKRFNLFQKNQADNEAQRKQRESIIKEAANEAAQEESTEPEVVDTPTPPEPPEQGQTDNEESSSSTESDDKGGTIVAGKKLNPKALAKKKSLISKAKKGLLADDEQIKMLT
jgi:hypothetical protein